MGDNPNSPKLTKRQAAELFTDPVWAARFPPILTIQQVAELCQVPQQTVYSWSSRGLLDPCKWRVGKYRRFSRDKLVQIISEDKLNGS